MRGVVVVARRGGLYVVIQRSQYVIAPGRWCFVGGAIEPGEREEDAVVREFAEEVGGVARPVARVWNYIREDGGLALGWWLADVEAGELHANPAEVAAMRWATLEEIAGVDGLLESNRTFIELHRRGEIVL